MYNQPMLQVFNDGNAKNFSTLEKKKRFFLMYLFFLFLTFISVFRFW